MVDNNDDGSTEENVLRPDFSQSRMLRLKNAARKKLRDDDDYDDEDCDEDDEDDDCDDEDCDEDDEDDDDHVVEFDWTTDRRSESDERPRGVEFGWPLTALACLIKKFSISASTEVRITASTEMSSKDVSEAFEQEVNRRKNYSSEYLGTLISDLEKLLRAAKRKKLRIERHERARQ